ncbi:hypothetical protein C5C25_00365 [Rathayibacter sp. AY2B9]|nr:hypothetical protein C5C25_00365 [Rathayibacter sp. AY2B9]
MTCAGIRYSVDSRRCWMIASRARATSRWPTISHHAFTVSGATVRLSMIDAYVSSSEHSRGVIGGLARVVAGRPNDQP